THLPPGGAAPKKPAAAAPADRRPAAAAVPGSPPGEKVAPRTPQQMPRGPKTPAQTVSNPGSKPAGPDLPPPDNSSPPRPFDLTARSIEAKILRSTVKSTIDELWCEGDVAVHQDPASADENGTDVKGDTLKMTARG